MQERIKRLDDGPELVGFFLQEPPSYDPAQVQQKGMDAAGTAGALRAAWARLEALDGWTCRTAAPPLFETMEVLGRERCLQRMQRALDAVASGGG